MVSHKKKLRSEKAKVKLKGAKLPKGLNVTKTEFKVRKITVREQLKDAHNSNGHRQFSLKEVLSRLKHHSSGFRLGALRHLREAIRNGHANISGNMNDLLQSVSAICLDIDSETRRDSFKALSCLLSTITVAEVSPFFHIISSYLRCAMTHIQPGIQEDSLLMLDVLLQHVPSLVATNSSKILQNFLEMISRVRNDGDKFSRTLTIRLGSKQTTVKWRTKVLDRLQQMLTARVIHQKNKEGGNYLALKQKQHNCLTFTFNPKAPQYFALKRPYNNNNQDFPPIFDQTKSEKRSTLDIDESDSLRSHIKHLLPLLIEAWLEVRPQEQTGQVLLSNESAQTLKFVLEIMDKLWVMVDLHEGFAKDSEMSNWFQGDYSDLFTVNFLTVGFPFQQSDNLDTENKKRHLKSSRNKISSVDHLCLEQNIWLTYLMCRFNGTRYLLKKQSENYVAVLKYLIQIVSNLTIYPMENYRPLNLALHIYLVKNSLVLLDSQPELMRSLLNVTANAFLQGHFANKSGIETQILTLLCEIVQTPEVKSQYGEGEFVKFLEYLPQLLLKSSINSVTLIAMSNLSKQNNAIFLSTLEKRIEDVIKSIQKIVVLGTSNAFEGKKLIMNLFYWTNKEFNINHEKKLLQQIDEYIADKRIQQYFKDILKK